MPRNTAKSGKIYVFSFPMTINGLAVKMKNINEAVDNYLMLTLNGDYHCSILPVRIGGLVISIFFQS